MFWVPGAISNALIGDLEERCLHPLVDVPIVMFVYSFILFVSLHLRTLYADVRMSTSEFDRKISAPVVNTNINNVRFSHMSVLNGVDITIKPVRFRFESCDPDGGDTEKATGECFFGPGRLASLMNENSGRATNWGWVRLGPGYLRLRRPGSFAASMTDGKVFMSTCHILPLRLTLDRDNVIYFAQRREQSEVLAMDHSGRACGL